MVSFDNHLEAFVPGRNTDEEFELKIRPNPFTNSVTIQFNLKQESVVAVTIYDGKGALVKQLFKGISNPGLQQFYLDGTNWSNGTYFSEVIIDSQRILLRKLVPQK